VFVAFPKGQFGGIGALFAQAKKTVASRWGKNNKTPRGKKQTRDNNDKLNC
jgi:hypothetical protein